MPRSADYYGVLGVAPGASDDEIRKAFRERVRACHPDRVATLDDDLRLLAEEKMVELNEAYAVLRSPSRRTAYDERLRGTAAAPAAGEVSTAATGPTSRRGKTAAGSSGTRSRIGEQRLVTTAAEEEFEHTVRRCVRGRVSWENAAFAGATLALHGRRGRSGMYFVLLAQSHLDPLRTQQFLHSLRAFAAQLGDGLLGRRRLFGFAGAVTFGEQARQRRTLDRFNRARSGRGPLQPATFIDLVNWHVIPGETSLQERLETLLRGG